MEGLGNDFVVLDHSMDLSPPLVRQLCDRHFGVGADGVLQVIANDGRVVMNYWNADGGAAEMCGNGLRCVALYAYENGLVDDKMFDVDTAVGLRRVEVGEQIRVEIGPVMVVGTREWRGHTFQLVSVGNPHAVSVGEDPDGLDVAEIGRGLEKATPGGINVGFAAVAEDSVKLRVWERGVGETLACGSGMVAAAAVAHQSGLVGSVVQMHVRGGEAVVELDDATTWLSGPARVVFRGEL
jgi:diaminopimelate epimerase